MYRATIIFILSFITLLACTSKQDKILTKEESYAFEYVSSNSTNPVKILEDTLTKKSSEPKKIAKAKKPTFLQFSKDKTAYSFCNPNAPDTLFVALKNNEYISPLLDSIKDDKYLTDVSIYDFNANDLVLYINFHIGSPKVEKLSNNKYRISSYSNLPLKGDWDGNWKMHKVIEFEVELIGSLYKIYKTAYDFNIPFDKNALEQAAEYVRTTPACQPRDRYISGKCGNEIEVFEYNMFVSILNNRTEYIKEYLALSEKYENSFGGQYAEYLLGNYMTLLMLKKIPISEHLKDWIPPYIVI